MTAPTPTATGTLASRSLTELLVYALDRQLDGTLVLETPDLGKSAISFERGAPAKAKTAKPVEFLGEVLVSQNVIDAGLYRRVLETANASRQLFGKVLVESGIATEDQLREALREQVTRKVLWMCTLPKTTVYGYYDGADFLARWGAESTRVKPFPTIWRAIRDNADPAHIDQALGKLGTRPLKLHFDAPVGRYKLTAHERGVVDVLRAKPQPLQALLDAGLGDADRVRHVVYGLLITRQLDFGVPGVEPLGMEEPPSSSMPRRVSRIPQQPPASPSRPPSPSPSARPIAAGAPSSPPAAEDPEVAELKRQIRERAGAQQNLYEVLGVAREAPPSAIRAAFMELAKKWHPDRLGPQFADVREQAMKVFARMSEAQQVLGDEQQRTEYDRLLREGGATEEEQEKVMRVLLAATAFQKAEVLLKKHNLDAALSEAKEALDNDPEQADHLALFAWIQAQKPRESYDELLRMLDEALRREPGNRRALWYRGQLRKRLGKEDAAIADFRALLENNPNHVEAQREVRVYQMRRENKEREKKSESSKSGLFGKWFKR